MYDNLNKAKISFDDLSDACKHLVQFCMQRRMSQSEVRDFYKLQVSMERCYKLSQSRSDGYLSSVRHHFKKSDEFVSFVVHERKRIVKEQGWKKAIIVNSLGIKQVGVFLSITRVIQRTIAESGGLGCVRNSKIERNDHGHRTFSCPLDSDIMRVESTAERLISRDTKKRLPKVFFSLYSDETLLSNSGSQDAAIIRIRVENVEGANLTRHDIGIPPKLDTGDRAISSARRRQAKLELFHRFLFLILEEIASVNIQRISRDLGFEPVLLGFVTDQPQERVFLCLMRCNCQQDCSFCCFRSAEDRMMRKRARQKLFESSVPTKKKKNSDVTTTTSAPECIIENSPSPSADSESDNSHVDDEIESVDRNETSVGAGIPIPSRIDRYVPRNAHFIVKMQLQSAVLMRKKTSKSYRFKIDGVNAIDVLEPQSLAHRKGLLASHGALPLPPAFACLKGICSSPNRLYTLPTIDLLHSLDLGPSKQFCDDAYLVWRKSPYSDGKIRKGLANTVNQRVSDLPTVTGCHGMRPFKMAETDRQASYTGKERRILCPVLWAVVMGLHLSVAPDKDPLFKSALYLDFMQAELKGVNRSIQTRHRTTEEIDSLEALCAVACNHFIQCFNANESTKIHRIMVHLGAHLRGYGNLRVSDTGPNETLHRGVKASYHATNKRQFEIAPQLLQVNISAETRFARAEFAAENHLLLTRDPTFHVESGGGRRDHQTFKNIGRQKQEVIVKEVRQVLDRIYKKQESDKSPEAIMGRILSIKDGFGRFKFSRKKRVTITASFEWDDDGHVQVRQTIYSKASTSKKDERFDSVRYVIDEVEVYGMVQGLLIRLPTRRDPHLSGETVLVVRVFEKVEPLTDNRLIVDKFGYQRLAFQPIGNDIRVGCIPLYAVTHRIVVLRDMWDVAVRYHPEISMTEIPDNPEERRKARFFITKNIQYTSIGEELLLKAEERE